MKTENEAVDIYELNLQAKQQEIARLRIEQSKQARKIDQLRQTIEHLHDRLSRLQASRKNKSSQIARLNFELDTVKHLLRAMVSHTSVYGEQAGEAAAEVLAVLNSKRGDAEGTE